MFVPSIQNKPKNLRSNKIKAAILQRNCSQQKNVLSLFFKAIFLYTKLYLKKNSLLEKIVVITVIVH